MLKRFWSKVAVGKKNECWLWLAAKDRNGYGRFNQGRRTSQMAHRTAYEEEYGPIASGMHILHTCDNPACVNPRHLTTGTHQENMQDRDRKGRVAKGENNGQSVLTAAKVREIVKLRGKLPQYRIAFLYGVSKYAIQDIFYGRRWQHITGE